MKKTHILFAALFSSLAFAGCNFDELQTPKEIKVRTDATYEFSVMSFDSEKEGSKLKLSDYFDLSKTLEEKTSESADSKDMKVYKYNDGSQFQQFLIHMPLSEVDFDFGESFKDMDFAKSMEGFDFNKEIEVPSVSGEPKYEPIDLSSINAALNGLTHCTGTSATNASLNFNYCDSEKNFSTIEYTSGKLIVLCTTTGTVTLTTGGDSTTPASFENGKAEINLNGKTISQSSTLDFSDPNGNFEAYVDPLDSNNVIKQATAVKLTGATVSVEDIKFTVSMSEDIKACTITNGSLTVAIPEPNTWSPGVISSYKITLKDGAGFDKEVTGPSPVSLAGTALSRNDIIAKTTITLGLDTARDITFDPAPKVKVTVAINTVSATVSMPDDYETTIPKEEPVSDSMKQYVEEIRWDSSGFDVIATNDLPTGNNITLKFTSNFFAFGVSGVSKDIIAEGDSATERTYNYRGSATTTQFAYDNQPNYFSKIDVNGYITLPGYNAEQNTISVTNVEPGKTYHLNLKIEPAFNWHEADVKLGDTSGLNDKMNTGMNKNTLFEAMGKDFAEKVKIRTMPVYVYGTIPDGLTDANGVEGVVKTYYATGSGETLTPLAGDPVYVIGQAGDVFETITVNPVLPNLTPNENGEIGAISGIVAGDFANSMNTFSETGTLCIDYDIRLAGSTTGSMTVTPAQVAAAQDPSNPKSTKMKMEIIMLMTMDFNVTDPVDIDMLAFANKKDGDLLGRSEATEASKYLDVIKSATISIEKFMLPMTGDISLSIDSKGDGTDVVKKAVGNGETYSIEVNPKEMLSTYPYSPNIKFVLEKGNFGILRTMPISGKIKLRVKAKGDIPIFSFAEQE